VLSLKTCLDGGNLVKQIMHAPWCITGCSSNNFHQGHMQRTSMGGGGSKHCFAGNSWWHVNKGAWAWLKAKASSGRTNNASKGVDERVWAVQLVEHAGTKVTKWKWSRWRKPSQGGARGHPSRSAQASPGGLASPINALPGARL
jgi:hypothetical protein